MKHLTILLVLICGYKALYGEETLQEVATPTEMIIFVHGTIRPPAFSFSSLVQIMRDKVDNTIYSRALNHIRNNPLFHYSQAMQELGLKKIDLSEDALRTTARTMGLLYERQYNHLNNSNKRLYYTFGWNGLLSNTKRYEAAELFYQDIVNELIALGKEGINPVIRVISYSHGSNVVLYLPQVRDNLLNTMLPEFTIDELIMLGAPIQKETDRYTQDRLFRKIYHLYSTEDNVQVMDLFSSQELFPRRTFTNRKDFKVPENLKQIRIRVTKDVRWRHKAHHYKEQHELLAFPTVRLIHKDPGHTELWCFKWGTYWYRHSFPLNPLPVAALVPTILNAIDQHPEYDHLVFDFAPRESAMMVAAKNGRTKKTFPFLTSHLQKELWNLAKKNEPLHFSLELQQQEIGIALNKAREDLSRLRKYRAPRNKTLAKYMRKASNGIFDAFNFSNKPSLLVASAEK